MQSDYDSAALALTGLQNYWPLTDGATTSFADSKGSKTLTSASALGTVTGPDGTATGAAFAGVDNRVLTASSVTMPESHTIAYWMKLNATPGSDAMAFEWNQSSFSKYVQHDLGYTGGITGYTTGARSIFATYYGTATGSNASHVDETSFLGGVWRFVVVTFDATQGSGTCMKVYIDGTLSSVTTGLTNYDQPDGAPGTGYLGVGGRNNAGTRGLALDGSLCGVILMSGVMSGSDMTALKNAMLVVGKSASDSATATDTASVGSVATPVSASDSVAASDSSAAMVSISPVSGGLTEYSSGITASANPYATCLGPDGNVWFTEYTGNRIGKITPAGTVTEYALAAGTNPRGICAGPDGNLWVCGYTSNKILKVTTSGSVTSYSCPTGASYPFAVASDGTDLWFTMAGVAKVGKVTTSGTFTEYSSGLTGATAGICLGPDGNVWFTESTASKVSKITAGGTITRYSTTTASANPIGICSDGTDLWFTELDVNKVGKVTTSGTVTEYSVTSGGPYGITYGPDGNVWFTKQSGNKLSSISPSGTVTDYALTTAGSDPYGVCVSGRTLWVAQFTANKVAAYSIALAVDSASVTDSASVSVPSTPVSASDTATATDTASVASTAIPVAASDSITGSDTSGLTAFVKRGTAGSWLTRATSGSVVTASVGADGTNNYPFGAVMPNGDIRVWYSDGSATSTAGTGTSLSTDGGATFGSHSRITFAAGFQTGTQGAQITAVRRGRSGRYHACVLRNQWYSDGTYGVPAGPIAYSQVNWPTAIGNLVYCEPFYMYSDDGVTWSTPEAVAYAGGSGACPADITELSNGDVIISWYGNGVTLSPPYTQANDMPDTGVSRLHNGTWSIVGYMGTKTGFGGYAAVEGVHDVIHDGSTYGKLIGTIHREDGVQTHYLTESTDGGATWTTKHDPFTATNKAGICIGPDGDVVLTYFDGTYPVMRVSQNGGASYGSAVQLNPSYSGWKWVNPFPIADAGVSPNVGVVWAQGPSDLSGTSYFRAVTAGATAPTFSDPAETATASDSASVIVGVGVIAKTASDSASATETTQYTPPSQDTPSAVAVERRLRATRRRRRGGEW